MTTVKRKSKRNTAASEIRPVVRKTRAASLHMRKYPTCRITTVTMHVPFELFAAVNAKGLEYDYKTGGYKRVQQCIRALMRLKNVEKVLNRHVSAIQLKINSKNYDDVIKEIQIMDRKIIRVMRRYAGLTNNKQ